MKSEKHLLASIAIAVLTCVLFLMASAQAQTNVVYSFPEAGDPYGAGPMTGFTADSAGNLYTTTYNGGSQLSGTVVELSPNGSGGWTATTLYAFTGGSDGSNPGFGLLIFDKAGNLYGTTVFGGAHGYGIVYKLSHSASGWKETVLYSFPGGNYNSYPVSGVIMDSAGNLYGTTSYSQGGVQKGGAVFELLKSSTGWTEKLLYAFPLGNNAGLTMNSAGNIFGVGSVANSPAVFELKASKGAWTHQVIFTFPNVPKDAKPSGAFAIDTSGNLYGVTQGNNTMGIGGTLYKLSPQTNGTWKYRLLYTFGGTSAPGGSQPFAGVILDAVGNIYGTTEYGGPQNYGTVFEFSPNSSGGYTEKILSDLGTGMDPNGRPLLDKSGNLFGTTTYGGNYNEGVAFELKP